MRIEVNSKQDKNSFYRCVS